MSGSHKDNLAPMALLLPTSFFVGLAQTHFGISAYSLCLSAFDARRVLYAIALASLVLPLAGQAYSWLSTRLAFVRVICLTFGLLVILMIAQWFGILAYDIGFLKLTVVSFCEFLIVFSSLVFWELASRVFPNEKDGSVYAILGAGFPVARAAGGATTAVFAQFFPTTHLLLTATLALRVGAILMVILARRYCASVSRNAEIPAATVPANKDNRAAGANKTAMILVFAALGVLGCSFANHIFDVVASSYYADGDQLARCFGRLEVLIGVSQFLLAVVVSGRFLGRCGPQAGLLVLPVGVALGAASMLIGWNSAGQPALVFWIAAATKVMDKVFRIALETPALMMIYQTFAPARRTRLMASVQAKIRPLASTAAAGLLILINTVVAWELGIKIALFLGIALIWCFVGVVLCSTCRGKKTNDGRSEGDAFPSFSRGCRQSPGDLRSVTRAGLETTRFLENVLSTPNSASRNRRPSSAIREGVRRRISRSVCSGTHGPPTRHHQTSSAEPSGGAFLTRVSAQI